MKKIITAIIAAGMGALEYDIDIISEELQRVIISRSSCR